MKLWSSFSLSQKRSLSSSYYKYNHENRIYTSWWPFLHCFFIFSWKVSFFFSKVLRENVQIIKYSNIAEMTVKNKSLPSLPLPSPSPIIQFQQKACSLSRLIAFLITLVWGSFITTDGIFNQQANSKVQTTRNHGNQTSL